MSDLAKEIVIGGQYNHFKNHLVTVASVATHTETEEELVIYIYNGQMWARPIEMFLSDVDKEKYPDVKQKKRFEFVGMSS